MFAFSGGILQFCSRWSEIVFRNVDAAVFYCKIPVPTHDRSHFLHAVELCNACGRQEARPDVPSGFTCAETSKVQPGSASYTLRLSSFFPPFPVFKKAFLKPPLPLFALPAFAVSADNKEFLINFSSGILHVVSKLVKNQGEKAAGENQS